MGTWGPWSDCDGKHRIREFNGYNCNREPEIQDCSHEAVGAMVIGQNGAFVRMDTTTETLQ